MMRIAWVVALAAAVVGCSKDSSKGGGAGTAGRDSVVAAWKQAGLTVSAMTPDKSGAIGDDCVTGTVSGVDVELCTFAKPEDATAAVAKGYTWVGTATETGTVLAQARTVLAVADRRKSDPSGRTINTITKTFRGR